MEEPRAQIGTEDLLAAIGHLYIESRALRAMLVKMQQEYAAPQDAPQDDTITPITGGKAQ